MTRASHTCYPTGLGETWRFYTGVIETAVTEHKRPARVFAAVQKKPVTTLRASTCQRRGKRNAKVHWISCADMIASLNNAMNGRRPHLSMRQWLISPFQSRTLAGPDRPGGDAH